MLKEVDAWYRVEDTPPSKVAAMAGFSTAGSHEALRAAEQEPSPDDGALEGGTAKEIRGFEVTWKDISAFPGGLLREMSDLAGELGYEGAPGLAKEAEASTRGEGTRESKKGWRSIFGFLRLPTEAEASAGRGGTGDGESKKGLRSIFGFKQKTKSKD
ncbi:unnamed protein product [Pylaiella littoralis]